MDNDQDKNGLPPEGENGENGAQAYQDLSRPAVAAAPKKMAIILVFAALLLIIVVRSLFFSGEAPKKEEKKPEKQRVAEAPAHLPADMVPTLPLAVVTPPPPAIPAPVITPPPPPPAPSISLGGFSEEELKKRVHSPMVVSGGGGLANTGASGDKKTESTSFVGNDANSEWARSIEQTHVAHATTGRLTNLNYTIAQGKIVEGVLESAINTDLPGMIRAIVSHDIYAEAGRAILIPKGSRIIGQYNSGIIHGQARVFIIWTRIIRPDGTDIMIESPGTDALGRAGLGGYVDNKYFEMFSTAIFTSTLDIGVAAVGDALFGNQQQTTTTGSSGTTTTSSPTATAMQTGIQNLGQVGSSIVNNNLSTKPTITVDQGTPINIFVNKDLEFPGQSAVQNNW